MTTNPSTCPRCGTPLPPDTPAEACPACMIRMAAELPNLGDPTKTSWGSGGSRPAPTPEEIAPDFPQLEILEVLGQGGMGVVYKARQKSLDRIVALKILSVPPDAGPTFTERFVREAKTLAGLSHPSIVTVHDFGRAGERYYLLMEYVDGTDLHRLIRAGAIRPRQALEMVSRVCEALQFAHDAGVVHRDIKPENILVDRRGRVKIADFGLARILNRDVGSTTLTGHGQVMGTAHYMAPEQLEHPLEVDHRADIYSLGVVFYELLTGELPIGRFEPPSKMIEVDVRVDDVVLRSLEKEPNRRYQHASQVKTAVDGISGTLREGAAPRRAARATRALRSPWLWGLVGTAIVAFVLAATRRATPDLPVVPAPPSTPRTAATPAVPAVPPTAPSSVSRGGASNSQAGSAPPALVVAASRGQCDIVASLLEAGADVDARASDGTTGLIAAADRREPKLVGLFLAKGADASARRIDGATPLLIAAARGDRESAAMLLRAKSDVNAHAQDGSTPLTLALDRREPELVAMLVKGGADVNVRRQDGVTPLILAAARGDRDSAELLARSGADVNARSNDGSTPLLQALDRRDPELAATLIAKGADVNISRQDGVTPLILAASRGDETTVRALLRKRAAVNTRAANGRSALDEAVDRGAAEIVHMLLAAGAEQKQP